MTTKFSGARMRLVSSAAVGAMLAFTTVTAASAEQAHRFDIPAQELTQALKRYALQADAQIVFADAVGAGVRSPSLSGQYTAEQALDQLLRGSSFTYSRLPSGVIRVHRAVAETREMLTRV